MRVLLADPLVPYRAGERLRLWLSQYVGHLADMLYPPRCRGCGRWGEWLCWVCWQDIRPVIPPFCPVCGQPMTEKELCPRCRKEGFQALEGARAAALYAPPLRQAIVHFKYRGEARLAHPLGEYMLRPLRHRPLRSEVIVPVPLHPDRLAQRGYNQAELLAAHLARGLGLPLGAEVLVRVRATAPQVTLGAGERVTNMARAFRCVQPEHVQGRCVLVVDDVMTTGSTLDACAVALKEAGAREVWGYTLARAVFSSQQAPPPDHPATDVQGEV